MSSPEFPLSNANDPLNQGFTINQITDPALLPRIGGEQTVSSNNLNLSLPIDVVHGLTARYYNNTDFTDLGLIRTDTEINFDWRKGSPHQTIDKDSFSVRWNGQVQPLYDENYTFHTQSDDGVRLWVNGQLLIDKWQNHSTREYDGKITLEAGKLYDLQLDYYENSGDAVSKLLWSSQTQAKEIIPTAQLYSTLPKPIAPGNGNGLTARYFNNTDFTDLGLIRTDKTINFDWGKGSPDSNIDKDTFSVRWDAQVQSLYSEDYTFSTKSDDGVRLWVNGQLLIDQWQNQSTKEYDGKITLEAGKLYDIQLEYYENSGDAVSNLFWSSNSQVKQIIPTSQLYSTLPTPFKTGFGEGLKGEYFDNKDLTASKLVRTDATIDFDWGKGSPDPVIGRDTFSATWTGLVQPLYSEKYTFSTQSDDGVRLWVNDQLLIDKWQNHSIKEHNGVITLEAGKFYDIQLDYYENSGDAVSKLLWSSNSQVKQIIPTSQLYKDNNHPLIGIIDTGFAANNPDINYSRITLGKDRVDNDNNPLLAEGEGNEHGTHILGIIAATQDNDLGIDGINNDAPIWLGRAIGDGKWAESLRDYVDAEKVSGRKNGVVNFSFDLTQKNADGTITTRYELTPEERSALEYARQNHILIVTAAGNNGGVMSVLGQASQEFDNIITVGAVDGDNRADYSSYGNGLDILADGGTVDNPILSTVGDGVGTMAGTSVAAVQVTGAASQVWGVNPLLSYRQVIEILKSTATDLNTPGWDEETGAGLLDMDAAIERAENTTPEVYNPDAFLTPTTWGGEGLVTPLERAVSGDGDTKETAKNIGILTSAIQVFNDRIDSNDKEDFYTFYIAEPGTANILITNLSENARVEFFKGSNIYPDLSHSTGLPLYSSTAYIDEPGQYFLRITQDTNPKDTDYKLQLSATSSVLDIGSLTGTRNIAATNNIVYYRFKLEQNSIVKASSNFPDLISFNVRDNSYTNTVAIWLNDGATLNAGTYYLAVSNNPYSGQPVPSSFSLNLQATPTSRWDNGSLDFRNAFDLGVITNSKSVTDFIDPTDRRDYYSFNVDSKSSVNLNVTALTGKPTLDVYLYNDQYNYIDSSSGFYGAPKPLGAILEAGKYYVQLMPGGLDPTDVQYCLDFNVQSLAPDDAIGNNFAQVKDLGSLYPNSPLPEIKDAIGGGDPADWVKFKLEKLGNILPVIDGLTAPVSLQLMRIESNGSLTDMGTLNSNGQSKWTPAFNNLPVGNYALVLTSNSSTSTPYALNISTVSTNVAPTNLKLNLAGTYSSNQDIVVNGSVYDNDGAKDIDEVWFNINDQTYFVRNFTPSSTDSNVATFSYNIGKLPIGSYGYSAGAYDKSRDSSGVTITMGQTPVKVVYAPIDTAGETFDKAHDLGTVNGTSLYVNEFVGEADQKDVFKFYVPKDSTKVDDKIRVTLRLEGLTADADLALKTSSGQYVGNSYQLGTNPENLSFDLSEGTYYIEVDRREQKDTNYTLRLTNSIPNVIALGKSTSGELTTADSQQPSRLDYFYNDYLVTGFNDIKKVKLTITGNGFTPKVDFYNTSFSSDIPFAGASSNFSVGNKTYVEFLAHPGDRFVRVSSSEKGVTGSYTIETIATDSTTGSGNSGGGSTGSILLGTDASGNQYPAFTTADDYYGVYGIPTSSVYRAGNGYIQEMQGLDGFGKYYLMLEDGASRAFLLGGDALNYYLNNGGVGRFGYPVSEVVVDPKNNFSTQYFENGSLVIHDGAVYGYDGPPPITGTPVSTPSTQPIQTGQVNNTIGLNFRSQPSESGDNKLGALPFNTKFTIIQKVDGGFYNNGSRNDWYEIEYNGVHGYVAAAYVDIVGTDNPVVTQPTIPNNKPELIRTGAGLVHIGSGDLDIGVQSSPYFDSQYYSGPVYTGIQFEPGNEGKKHWMKINWGESTWQGMVVAPSSGSGYITLSYTKTDTGTEKFATRTVTVTAMPDDPNGAKFITNKTSISNYTGDQGTLVSAINIDGAEVNIPNTLNGKWSGYSINPSVVTGFAGTVKDLPSIRKNGGINVRSQPTLSSSTSNFKPQPGDIVIFSNWTKEQDGSIWLRIGGEKAGSWVAAENINYGNLSESLKVSFSSQLNPIPSLTEDDYQKAANILGCEVALIKTVVEVESPKGPFLPSGKPTILFEAHLFSKFTGGQYDKSHPNISSPVWNQKLYGAEGEHQYTRLEEAMNLNREAALRATSWGAFQILGDSYKTYCDFNTIDDFVAAMKKSVQEQLSAFVNFVKNKPGKNNEPIVNYLRDKEWAKFAYYYNGSGYKENNYDSKLETAYKKYSG